MKFNHNKNIQRFLGLMIGIAFGFLLHKGGVTKFDIIVSQLRLKDFTVLQIILSSIIVAMLGISYLYPHKIISLKAKRGSLQNAVIGGLIFGVGFALLGLCPGTIAGSVGNGSLDSLFAGLTGIIIGSFLFAVFYKKLRILGILKEDKYSGKSLFDKIEGNPFKYTLPAALILTALLIVIEILLV